MTGNLLVGQSGGPTSVINASLAGVFKTAKDLGIETVYGMRYGIEGFIKGKYVDMSDCIKGPLDLELLKRTPSSYLGSCRYKLKKHTEDESDYKTIFNRLKELDIKYVLYIGGNDSMDTIHKLSDYADAIGSDVRFVGVPKTIDNDLAATDHTPGFGSAAKYIASSFKEIIRDSSVYDIKSVTVVEIMGRNAGWLTAASVLSEADNTKGPDLVYLPEKPFETERFLKKIDSVVKERGNVIVAVSEGIKTPDGRYLEDGLAGTKSVDVFGHTMLGGTALALSDAISATLGYKSRGIVLSTLQRCASHISSATDVAEAFEAGASAVRCAKDGESGIMITFKRLSDSPYSIKTESEDIKKIANAERLVPSDWILEDGGLKIDEIKKYALPLIEGDLFPIMASGVPQHLVLREC